MTPGQIALAAGAAYLLFSGRSGFGGRLTADNAEEIKRLLNVTGATLPEGFRFVGTSGKEWTVTAIKGTPQRPLLRIEHEDQLSITAHEVDPLSLVDRIGSNGIVQGY